MSSREARFGVGDLVHHLRFDYRGVIFDVDATFQGSEAWYLQMAISKPPKDAPWYHVLVDGAAHSTYVAERNLEPDADGGPISHPLVGSFLGPLLDGRYRRKVEPN